MKTFLSFLTRRELLLVSLTAAVCFAIAIPMSGAATHDATPVSLEPGGAVVFPNLNWHCTSVARTTAVNRNAIPVTYPAHVICSTGNAASSDISGKWVAVDRNRIIVGRCTNGVLKCPTLGKWKRTG